jgi:hypothetical protein
MSAGMTTYIMVIHSRMRIEEMTSCIMAIDGKVPAGIPPNNGTQEIICSHEKAVLPIIKDITEIGATMTIAQTIDIAMRTQTEQIIEVDFISIIILVCIEIQLVCHLIRKIKGLVTCLLVTH